MKLVRLLWSHAPGLLIVCLISSVLEGMLKLYLVATVTKKIMAPATISLGWGAFLLLASVAAGMHVVAQVGITYTARLAANDLRRQLVESVITTRLIEIEKAGGTRILAALTEDGARLVAALPATVGLLRDVTFSAICMAYLAWISPRTFLLVGLALLLVAGVYHPLQLRGIRQMRKIITVSESLFEVFRNLFDGIKQVKLSVALRDGIVTAIAAKHGALKRYTLSAFVCFGASAAIAMFLLLALLSTVAYGQFASYLQPQSVATYAVLLIMLMGPLGSITSTLHSLSQAETALDRLQDLRRTFHNGSEPTFDGAAAATGHGATDTWRLLEMRDVTYAYESGGKQSFALQSVTCQLHPGQVLFIVGGNGSGKTTLAKLLVGFYAPHSGVIRLDGRTIDDSNRAWYRHHFSTVFNDYSLFESLADSASDLTRRIGPAMLRQFRIDHLLYGPDELFGRAKSFSTGERKRTALLLACLDDRPIYLFDEFAADQDPECRELFYREIVPSLKARAKLVIVVSHDTRYFDCADLILTLERGAPPQLTCAAPSNLMLSLSGTS